jgi:hypothetical protein
MRPNDALTTLIPTCSNHPIEQLRKLSRLFNPAVLHDLAAVRCERHAPLACDEEVHDGVGNRLYVVRGNHHASFRGAKDVRRFAVLQQGEDWTVCKQVLVQLSRYVLVRAGAVVANQEQGAGRLHPPDDLTPGHVPVDRDDVRQAELANELRVGRLAGVVEHSSELHLDILAPDALAAQDEVKRLEEAGRRSMPLRITSTFSAANG